MTRRWAAGTPGGALHRVAVGDGRCLAYRCYGDPTGQPVVALHGTPGSHLKFAALDDKARACGVRLVAVDRWGYGASGTPRQPSLGLFADDVERLLDVLECTSAGVLGISGGGPYAVALASRLPQRIEALALVAPVGPIAGPFMGTEPPLSTLHTFCFRVLPRIPGGARLPFAVLRRLLNVAPGLAIGLVTARAAVSDRTLLALPGVRAALVETFRGGLYSGVDGAVIDMTLFAQPWGVDPSAIKIPARLWLGDADGNVPLGPARSLARAISSCELISLPAQGHYWITGNAAEVVEWIAETLRSSDTQTRANGAGQ